MAQRKPLTDAQLAKTRKLYGKRRSFEGDHFERFGVVPVLVEDGYEVTRAHMSEGPYDFLAFKVGQLLLIAARLTKVGLDGVGAANPTFRGGELDVLWGWARQSAPGFEIVPLVATAYHAAAPGKVCVCSGEIPDEVRFLRLTGPHAKSGQRGNWEPWTTDAVAAAQEARGATGTSNGHLPARGGGDIYYGGVRRLGSVLPV